MNDASEVTLLLHAFAPPLVAEDTRSLAVVQAMERGMAGLRLEWTISDDGSVLPVPHDERGTWRKPEDGGFLLLCNADSKSPVTLSQREIPAELCPGGKAQLDVFAEWPMNDVGLEAAADVLAGVAEACRAFWAHVTPSGFASVVWDQMSHTPGAPMKSPGGLPMLKQAWDIRSADIPRHLGWLNYWSAAAARAIGFPDPNLDVNLMARSRRTQSGGWVVRLTDEPLDARNPAHIQAVMQAYERFPVIGGRAPA